MRDKRFTILLTEEERQILVEVARRLRRSQSDTMRWLLLKAADGLEISESEGTVLVIPELDEMEVREYQRLSLSRK